MRAGLSVVVLLAAALSGCGTRSELRVRFRNPAKACRPMVRWWWPGGDVADAELRREVRLLDEANFGGAEIQPFRIGLNPKAPPDMQKRVDNYLTPEFYGHVRAALDEAVKRGMWLDYTFGSGWPFGGENITPELASMELRFAHQTLKGPSKYNGKLPLAGQPPGIGTIIAHALGTPERLPEGWDKRLKDRRKIVAVVAIKGEAAEEHASGPPNMFGRPNLVAIKSGMLDMDSAVVLTNRVSPDGRLSWDVPRGNWQLFTFAEMPADLRVIGGAGAGPQLVLDHWKRAAMEAHIRRVGGSAKEYIGQYFGKGLRAIFCDSLEVQAYLYWTDSFLAGFKRLRGYDLTPFLPLLKKPGTAEPYGSFESLPLYDAAGGLGDRIRHDYWRTVSDLMVENFFRPFDDWAKKNGLLARVQAHGSPADVLKIYGLSDIPETENLYAGGRYDFLKYAASAAHVYGRNIVSSESFVRAGNPYATTPEIIKTRADELLTAGINQIIYHGFPYEYMDRAEPGWHPFLQPLPFSSHMNRHNPFWPYLPALNLYIARLQYISQTAANQAQVAVFRGNLAYEQTGGAAEPEIDIRLIEAGYSFDHINEDALLGSRVEGGRLITPGGASYGQIMLLNETRISLELAEKLAGFISARCPVLFVGSVPREEAGYKDYRQRTERIRSLLNERVPFAANVTAAITALRENAPPNVEFRKPAGPVFFFDKRIGETEFYFLRNGSAEARDVEVVFPALGSPQIWDAWTGETSPALDFERSDGGVRMQFELAPYGSRLIAFDPSDNHAPRASSPQPPGEPLNIAGPWKLIAGDAGLMLPDLVDWSQHPQLRSFSGKAQYAASFRVDAAYLRPGSRVELDLGDVKDVAEIRLNGKPGPVLLMRPYRATVTPLLVPGENTLEVFVTNSLTNRLIAAGINLDGMRGAGSPMKPVPAGLIGPVRLVRY